MSAPAVRIQLPAGHLYAPALVDAASKFAARSALDDTGQQSFVQTVSALVDAVNSATPSTVELEIRQTSRDIRTVVRGQKPTGRVTARTLQAVEKLHHDCTAETGAAAVSFGFTACTG